MFRSPLLLLLLLVGPVADARASVESIEHNGDLLRDWIPRVAFATTLFYEDGWDGSIQFVESYVVTNLATAGLKRATHKRRPNGACCSSFPSGHTSRAFMGAAFINARYGWKWSVPAYAGATYVAYSRVHADKHDVVDVIGGAAVGIGTTFLFTRPYEKVHVEPVAGDGYLGISVSGSW